MQGPGHNQWVVLLNKIPRGPFSADEIRSLLNQGLLRHNDLALLVQSENESGVGAWKFLWQYSEFDSRLPAKDPSQIPAAVLEKRQPKNEEQVAQAVKELIPLDLQSIRIEDLIVKASSGVRKELGSLKAGESSGTRPAASSFSRFEKIPTISARNVSGILVLVCLLVGGWIGVSKLKVKPEETASAPPAASKSVPEATAQPGPPGMRMPAGARMLPQPRNGMQLPTPRLPGPGPGPGSMMPPQPGRPPMPAFIPNNVPRERDRGEIREDEIRRMRAEELRREQEEREMQRRRESEEQRQMEEGRESTGPTGNSPKSRGARPGPSDSEGDEEPPLENETEPPPRSETDEPPPSSWVE